MQNILKSKKKNPQNLSRCLPVRFLFLFFVIKYSDKKQTRESVYFDLCQDKEVKAAVVGRSSWSECISSQKIENKELCD